MFTAEHARRAGVEGTHSQGVRRCGLRRSRYVGLANTAAVLHDAGAALPDRIQEFTPTIMAVDAPTHLIACLKVLVGG